MGGPQEKVSELQKDRIAAARELAARDPGAVCVKDACTVTAVPGSAPDQSGGKSWNGDCGKRRCSDGKTPGVLAMFLNKRTELPDTGRQVRLGSTASWYGRAVSGSEKKKEQQV